MNSEKTFVGIGFTLISIIWGSTWLAIKIGLDSIPPFYGVAIRFTVALIILYIIMRVRGDKLPVDRTSWKLFLMTGVFSFSFPFMFAYWGEQYISSGLASVLFAIYPLVVATLSYFVLPDEQLNPYKSVGIILGFLGVLIIFWIDVQAGKGTILGMASIFVSSVFQGVSLVFVKKMGKHLNPFTLNFGGMLVGIFIIYAMALTFEDYTAIHLDAKGVGSILYLGTFGTVVTFSIYYWLLKRVEAVFLSLVSLVTPVFAVILGIIWLDESLSPRLFFGAGLVLIGILVTNGKEFVAMFRNHRDKLFSI